MKVEVCCSSCSQCFLLDAELDGVELMCPACSAPMRVGIDRPSVQAAAAPPVADTTRGETQAVDRPAPAAAPVAPPPDEVVCPRCNLHFRPRAGNAPSGAAPGDLPTVLVVEDMALFRDLATDALQGSYLVKTAATLAEARAHLREGGIDLLLLDPTFDGGDHGIDLLRELPRKLFPVLIYSAEDESELYGENWEELQSLGADDIVMKGLNVGESLLRKVGSLLGREEEDLTEGVPRR